jgi:hypothetical protein
LRRRKHAEKEIPILARVRRSRKSRFGIRDCENGSRNARTGGIGHRALQVGRTALNDLSSGDTGLSVVCRWRLIMKTVTDRRAIYRIDALRSMYLLVRK